jgi:hypothetical protein
MEASMPIVPASGKSSAVILDKDGGYIVRPAHAWVDGTANALVFRIRNMTDSEAAEVKLPKARVAQGSPHKGTIEPGEDFVTELAKINGKFSYKVKVDGVHATGESDPVIIIDPPCP